MPKVRYNKEKEGSVKFNCQNQKELKNRKDWDVWVMFLDSLLLYWDLALF